ncbi:sugar ABC transporter ATP-binding protein [Albimonas sp. CAU 1670]|uniref:sugar ABC transporter ATP-binding protein n=1 Tax=Albimonas sp. CAU 1670 TaxID=3032599 RepID=UPI0023DBC372|nr:sugar ABC transporter ATP-binding protein [Albimonas sp. CAU 1670]MDF2235795.1 sugar ABC transporter ATP-binding protein [Albimonas sp. CAU 1670]
MTAPLLAARAVSRRFGPNQVLFDVDFDLRPGEVHALIGENGAGKSTLMKILSGYLAPSDGGLEVDGAPTSFPSHREAEAAGVVLIHQEFNLAMPLTVEENIFLGRELRRGPFLRQAEMRAESRRLLARLDCDLDPRLRCRDLSAPERQMVEIAKALGRDARVLIMDEPTAVLTARETDLLLAQIDRLRAAGTAILYTSHKLGEVARIADRVTVLRDGRRVASRPAAGFSEHEMAEAMVGRELSDLFPPKPVPQDEVVLEVRGLTVPGHAEAASFQLRRGEVLGIAGLVGAGRTELMEGLAGLRPATGEIALFGKPVRPGDPRAMREAGLVYLTEDRKEKGLLLGFPLSENLTLLALENFTRAGLRIDKAAEMRALRQAVDDFAIAARDLGMTAGGLSGGNQQKLLLAKTLLAEPGVVIIDEPTRGVDIGAKAQIYAFIAALAAAGKSVIVVSSELPEVIGLASRVMVMRRGRIAGVLEGGEVGETAIVRLAMGVDDKEPEAA